MRKIKVLLTFSLLCCFTLMLGAGIISAAGTNQVNSMTSLTAQSNLSSDNRSMNSNNMTSNSGGNYRANATNNDNDFDWGWLGLLGLIGLAGMRGRNHDRNSQRS